MIYFSLLACSGVRRQLCPSGGVFISFHFLFLFLSSRGRTIRAGAENNTQYNDLYATRKSYNDASFSFSANFTKQYMKDSCRQWYNLGVPRRLIFGGTTFEGDLMSDMGSMRAVVATFDAPRLAKEGLRFTDWLESGGGTETKDVLSCPASGPSLDDCSCIEDFEITDAIKAGDGTGRERGPPLTPLTQFTHHALVQFNRRLIYFIL